MSRNNQLTAGIPRHVFSEAQHQRSNCYRFHNDAVQHFIVPGVTDPSHTVFTRPGRAEADNPPRTAARESTVASDARPNTYKG
ncbi:MAG: hypothetical protein ACOY90_06040 [Candidatus Zhuqueibacterota bacterium]